MNGVFGQKAYTLDECIQAALTNNVRMKNANNELDLPLYHKKELVCKLFFLLTNLLYEEKEYEKNTYYN